MKWPITDSGSLIYSVMYFMGINLPDGSTALQPQSENIEMNGMSENSILADFDEIPLGLEHRFSNSSGLDAFASHLATTQSTEGASSAARPSTELTFIENRIAGTGPLLANHDFAPAQDRGNGVTEFTKRRNWSQRILEEIQDFLHILTPDGRIIYISPSGEQLTGYTKDELRGNFIVDYVHPDDSGMFIREFNESIASGRSSRFFYRFRKKDDAYAIFESHGHPHLASDAASYDHAGNLGTCRGFFMMARPYPTKNSALLDSFLEHKIENQRLMKRINDLRKEEAEEENDLHLNWPKRLGQSKIHSEKSDTIFSGSTVENRPIKYPKPMSPNGLAMPPPAKVINLPLTRQALEKSNAGLKPDSIRDKMARFDGISHVETIEMMTGLRYHDGERSLGISTGAQSPVLIKGDAGIVIPFDKESKCEKKKSKLPDEYVCTDCGTLDSPEWRKGPSGPKTLCNACGLRWAKKEKKKPTVPDSLQAASVGEPTKG
ncbi:BgTH12-07684 [Blumeria graminis f. sp. triticale]|uniref:BgTH12-07684 n=1 Tax=Blumeria graminis f. sp. triticale TaxID=1689686 RepID=A0A9W4CXE3_BLUGR|nr:BgTH12-07684 [Blumeria graminis f. sp. triticale]